ncbi:hypothetical protein [uncultured Paludibaculum sp.]|uniref:hypothetical protein n=1 Tax=uncultured Paludibaculum sp. TaxID=1765020 RepID=UPI002AAAC64A|nr:hypothetical protein [uncultured Paludibaculum sp.]
MHIRILPLLALTAALCAAQSPAPELTLSVNGQTEARFEPGPPLMVQLSALHPHLLDPEPGEDVPPVILPALDNSWANAVHLTLFNEQGEPVDIAFTLHTPPEQRLELAHGEQAEAWWSLSPDQTAALPLGRYLVHAVLDTTSFAVGDEWNGAVTLDNVPLILTEAASEPTVADQAAGHRLSAQYAALLGNWDEALQHVDAWITIQPESGLPYAMKGDLLTRAGHPLQAAQVYTKAMDLDAAATQAAEVHVRESHNTLDGKISEILRALAKSN